jgi:hypothetical protein
MVLTTYNPPGSATVYEIHVEENGEFQAVLDGEVVERNKLLSALRETLSSRTREAARAGRAKVRVAVLREIPGGLEAGHVYGIHAGTGNLMVAWPGSKQQLAVYDNTTLFRPEMPADQQAHFAEVAARWRADGQELARLRTAWREPIQTLRKRATVEIEQAERASETA